MEISLEKYEAMQDRIAELETANKIRSKQVEYLTDTVVKRDKEIDHLRAKQPRWISVKDRLPNFEQPVLAYSGEELGIGFAYLDGDGKWYGDCGDVTHWMPLPEPPEVEDGRK